MNCFLITICLLLASSLPMLAEESADSTDANRWKLLGAPYLFANSDFGLIYGVGGGISKYPDVYIIYGASGSTKGEFDGGISAAQIVTRRWRFENKTRFSKSNRYIYTLHDNDPETVASAVTNLIELQFGVLHRFGQFEIGSTLLLKKVKSGDVKDSDDNPITADYSRFREADLELIGVKSRYQTTNIIRPMDGLIFESMIRAGRMGYENHTGDFDADAEIKLGYAKPTTEDSRLYARIWSQFQLNAIPPLQNFLGWERNHRGQPFGREWGRRVLSGRIQYHLTVARKTKFPLVYIHNLISLIQPDRLDWEVVPFYDIGAVGDPSFGWHKTRHGIGFGLHVILPPELVFRLDIAFAPGGPVRFFLGPGETL